MKLTDVDKDIIIPLIIGAIGFIICTFTLGCCEHSSYVVPQSQVDQIVAKNNCTDYKLQEVHWTSSGGERQGLICDGELLGWFMISVLDYEQGDFVHAVYEPND